MNSFQVGMFAFFSGIALCVHNGMAEGFSFSHKDWELACDNTRTCRAAGYQANGDERLVSMLLTREAGPNTPVSMELQLDDKGKPADVRAQVGELIISSLAVGKIPQKEAAKLLAVMPDEEKMILTAGDKQWKLSLAGLKAMLLKMDNKQRRIGAPGALIAKGTKPEQQVLPPVPIKTVAVSVVPPTTKEDEKVLAALKEFLDAECDASQTAKDACKTERKIERLSEDKLLISLLVDRAAYNQTIAVWIVNDKPPYNPTPAIEGGLVYNSAKESAVEVLQSTGILESSAKGREMADCWNWASWAWTGKSFEKANESSTGMCKGFSSGAWSLPTFVSEVVDEYKAPSGEWKFIVKQDKVNRRTGDSSIVTAVSPEGKQTHVDDGIRNAEVKWINGETIEIIDKCGFMSECRNVYFFDIHKGLLRIFQDAVAYSIQDNLIAYPSYNEKKKRIEIIISGIYSNKTEPVAVIYRKWSDQWTDWVVMFFDKQAVNKGFFIGSDKIHLEYVEKESEEIKKEDMIDESLEEDVKTIKSFFSKQGIYI